MPAAPCPPPLTPVQGPSSEALHLGHLVPFLFTKYLQVGLRALPRSCELSVQ